MINSIFILCINLFDCFRKWSGSTSASSVAVPNPLPTPIVVPPPAVSPPLETPPQNSEATDAEWTYDPNEPRYCICNQVSYGDMVACDNEDVSILSFIKLSIVSNFFCIFSVLTNGFIIRVWV